MRGKTPGGMRSRPLGTPTRRSIRLFGRTPRALPVLLNQENGDGKSESKHLVILSDSEVENNDGRLSPQNQMGHSNNSEGLMDLDNSLEKGETCIRCKVRDEQVLVCSEIGCLISVHDKCMGCDPTFDDLGKFCCPYCKHRRARAVTLEMRRRVTAAKKALLTFLEGGDKEKEKDCDERDKTKECENDLEKGLDDVQVGCRDQDKVVLENEAQPRAFVVNDGDNVGGGGEGMEIRIESHQGSITKETLREDGEDKEEEDSEPMDDGKDEGIAEGNEEREVLNTSPVAGERIPDGVVDGSNRGADIRVSKENEGVEEDEKKMQPESSEGLANTEDISETESLVKRHRRFKQRAGKKIRPQNVSPPKRSSPRPRKAFLRQKCTAKKNALVFQEKATISKKSQQSSKQIPIMDFPIAKRKRLLWTAEEEEMLREGVQEFSVMANVNLPWKKIWEYGRHVFDPSRTPVDLKDKWRNLMAKEVAAVNSR